jgi:hypothetical protein
MAAAVGLLVVAIGSFHKTRVQPPAAGAAALLFAFTPLVWSQAVVAEVYALNLFMLAAFILAWSRGASGWSGLWLGLAITTHLTSILVLPMALASGGRRRSLLCGLALGLAPLTLLPWLARGDSPIVWGDPVNATGWWWLVSAQLFAANLRFTPDGGHLLALLQAIVLGPAGLIVAGKAAIAGLDRAKPLAAARHENIDLLLLGGTAAFYGVLAYLYRTPDAAALLIPGLMILILLIARILERIGPFSLILPLALVIVAFPARDLSRDRRARTMAEELLRGVPENTLLLTPGDRTIFTLWYFHHVEGQRPDVRLVDANLFAFDWYRARLSRQYPEMIVPGEDDLAALQRENQGTRPFCLAGLVEESGGFPLGGFRSATFEEGPPYLICTEEIN